MLQFINSLPPHVLGIHAIGEVQKDDLETVLIPRLDNLVAKQDAINYILVLESDVQKFTLGAWWEDLMIGLKHFTKWKKIAIVSDQKGVGWFTDVFRYFIPGQSRGFALAKLDEAVKWIAEK